MKISVLQRAPPELRHGDPTPAARNLDPRLHPFAKPRERVRALNAAKISRIFAKPFLASLDGHADAVNVIVRHPRDLVSVASASWDGTIILHHLAQRIALRSFPHAHSAKVSGLCFADDSRLLSCGHDRAVKLWSLDGDSSDPVSVFPTNAPLNSIDHHRNDPLFATASNLVQIWDETKSVFPLRRAGQLSCLPPTDLSLFPT
jgi:DDB1- and CUL4-associated factor 13